MCGPTGEAGGTTLVIATRPCRTRPGVRSSSCRARRRRRGPTFR
jgi:hypothetical protein